MAKSIATIANSAIDNSHSITNQSIGIQSSFEQSDKRSPGANLPDHRRFNRRARQRRRLANRRHIDGRIERVDLEHVVMRGPVAGAPGPR